MSYSFSRDDSAPELPTAVQLGQMAQMEGGGLTSYRECGESKKLDIPSFQRDLKKDVDFTVQYSDFWEIARDIIIKYKFNLKPLQLQIDTIPLSSSELAQAHHYLRFFVDSLNGLIELENFPIMFKILFNSFRSRTQLLASTNNLDENDPVIQYRYFEIVRYLLAIIFTALLPKGSESFILSALLQSLGGIQQGEEVKVVNAISIYPEAFSNALFGMLSVLEIDSIKWENIRETILTTLSRSPSAQKIIDKYGLLPDHLLYGVCLTEENTLSLVKRFKHKYNPESILMLSLPRKQQNTWANCLGREVYHFTPKFIRKALIDLSSSISVLDGELKNKSIKDIPIKILESLVEVRFSKSLEVSKCQRIVDLIKPDLMKNDRAAWSLRLKREVQNQDLIRRKACCRTVRGCKQKYPTLFVSTSGILIVFLMVVGLSVWANNDSEREAELSQIPYTLVGLGVVAILGLVSAYSTVSECIISNRHKAVRHAAKTVNQENPIHEGSTETKSSGNSNRRKGTPAYSDSEEKSSSDAFRVALAKIAPRRSLLEGLDHVSILSK